MQEYGARGGKGHQLRPHLVGPECVHPFHGLTFLAHRDPDIGADRVCPFHGLGRGLQLGDGPSERADSIDGHFVEAVTGRRRHCYFRARHRAGQSQAAGDVVAVAHPGHAAPCQLAAPVGAQRQQVRYRLERVGTVREKVDDRDAGDGCHALQDGVVEDPGADRAVVLGKCEGDVLSALPIVDAYFVAPDRDGVTS